MKKVIVKHGNSLAIVIDKPICELFDLKLGSKLKMSVEDGSLVLGLPERAPDVDG
ncbi:MAG: AbrB/MazE/SpoVT family DNA-binding domain-containing protein [Nitrosomonadaceae bacterium]